MSIVWIMENVILVGPIKEISPLTSIRGLNQTNYLMIYV